MVNVIAHRGFSAKYPENTEIAFLEAIALNVDMIEFDVQLSRDAALVVVHDPTIDRTSNGRGKIDQMTLSEIKALDAGSWFGDEFKGQCFLTLQQALDILDSGVRLNVHIKAYEHTRQQLVSLTVQELARRNLLRQVFVGSDQQTIELAKSIRPELEISNLSIDPEDTYISRSLAIGCRILQPLDTQVDPTFVKNAHCQGMEVNPFYANDVHEMSRLIQCGVDGILTDYPDRLLALRGKS